MRSSARYWVLVLGLGSSLCASASAGGVRVVRPQGNLNFSGIQPAIDVAQDGDIVLVGQGSYGGFTILDKSICVMAVPGDDVLLQGQVAIRNLAEHRTVLLDGFRADFFGGLSEISALWIEDNLGHVRIQNCDLTGSKGDGDFWNGQKFEGGPGGPGAVLIDNLHVAFVHSTLRGGSGWSSTELVQSEGGHGGVGLTAQGTALALYDCEIVGGQGGYVDSNEGGKGGDGAQVFGFGIFASGSKIRGGNGGHTNSSVLFVSGTGGDGGDGLHVESGAQAQLLDNVFAGGLGGQGSAGGPNGQGGANTAGGGVFHVFPGSATSFALQTSVAGDQGSEQLTVQGTAGDAAFLFQSAAPGWRSLTPSKPGIVLVRGPSSSTLSGLGIISGAGTLSVSLPLGELPPSALARTTYSQGYVYGFGGQLSLASPMHFVTINRDAAPDCNANLVNDYVEMLEGGVDCNGNLVPDACDIASGTSPDANANGIPDECEPAAYYVDASAPLGGNGSLGAPFRTIAQGMAAAVAGDSVIVRDGLYTGTGNRGLRFKSGQDITVRSEHGPENCIIDCQLLDRAFDTINQWPAKPTIEGFTIRNGKPSGDGGAILIIGQSGTQVAIKNCVIRDSSASTRGGGVYFSGGGCRGVLEDCLFLNNSTSTSAPTSTKAGGGLAFFGARLSVKNCTFEGNLSVQGGGMYVSSGFYATTIANCVLRGNTATERGGGILLTGSTATNVPSLQNCLIVGNSAGGDGGGICIPGTNQPLAGPELAHILDSTIAANTAARGGGILVLHKLHLDLANSIIWGNSAPTGPQLGLEANSLPTDLVVDISYCDVEGGQPGVHVGAGNLVWGAGNLVWGAGNLELDPLFSDAEYRIELLSPCVDSGDNFAVPPDLADLDGDGNTSEPLPIDLDGNPRFTEVPSAPNSGNGSAPFVDMGPYERLP